MTTHKTDKGPILFWGLPKEDTSAAKDSLTFSLQDHQEKPGKNTNTSQMTPVRYSANIWRHPSYSHTIILHSSVEWKNFKRVQEVKMPWLYVESATGPPTSLLQRDLCERTLTSASGPSADSPQTFDSDPEGVSKNKKGRWGKRDRNWSHKFAPLPTILPTIDN